MHVGSPPEVERRVAPRAFRRRGPALVCQEEQPESLLPFNGWRRKVSFLASLPGVGLRRYELKIKQGPPARTAVRPSIAYTLSGHNRPGGQSAYADGTQCLRGNLLEMLVVHDDGDSWGTDRWSYRDLVGRFAPEPGSVRVIESGPVRTITDRPSSMPGAVAFCRRSLQRMARAGIPPEIDVARARRPAQACRADGIPCSGCLL